MCDDSFMPYHMSCTHGKTVFCAMLMLMMMMMMMARHTLSRLSGICQSQTPNDKRNGTVDDTVLSKITTKWSFTVL